MVCLGNNQTNSLGILPFSLTTASLSDYCILMVLLERERARVRGQVRGGEMIFSVPFVPPLAGEPWEFHQSHIKLWLEAQRYL